MFCILVRITSPRLSGRLPSAASASEFDFASDTQRIPSSQRPRVVRVVRSTSLARGRAYGQSAFPRHTHWPSVPLAVSTPGSQAVGSPGHPVLSAPPAAGPVRVSACSRHGQFCAILVSSPRLTGSHFTQPAKGSQAVSTPDSDARVQPQSVVARRPPRARATGVLTRGLRSS